jgi:hypothetical protein
VCDKTHIAAHLKGFSMAGISSLSDLARFVLQRAATDTALTTQAAHLVTGSGAVAAAVQPVASPTTAPAAITAPAPAHGHQGDSFGAPLRAPSLESSAPSFESQSRNAGLGSGVLISQAVPPATAPTHVDVRSLSAADRRAFVDLYRPFGRSMVTMHEAWHQKNGSGGTRGVGSGELFMQFHDNLMKDFLAVVARENPALSERLGGRLPSWDTMTQLPREFEFADMNPTIRGSSTGINWQLPSYLTVEGGTQRYSLNDGGERRRISSLNDIRSPDELGRVLGASGTHAVGHSRLGGGMSSFASVAEPPFVLWHGKMVEIQEAWSTTPSGQAWLAANPSGWSDPRANRHEGDHTEMAMPLRAVSVGIEAAPAFTNASFANELERLAAQQ